MGNSGTYVIGMDYGTDSVRSMLLDVANGNALAISEFKYPRWRDKFFCDSAKNQFRQHPLDYIEGLEHTVRDIFRPSAWNSFGSESEGADYRACSSYGPLYS